MNPQLLGTKKRTWSGVWFSDSYLRLVNKRTKDQVEVVISRGPNANGKNIHSIAKIDYVNSEISLKDGSIWSVGGDFNTWKEGDQVIIGNLSVLTDILKPNILVNINVIRENYVIAGPRPKGNITFYPVDENCFEKIHLTLE